MGIVPLSRLPIITLPQSERLAVRGWAHEWITNQLAPIVRSVRSGVGFDSNTVTDQFLVDLWYRQGGKCALTGRPMVIPNWRVLGQGCTTRMPRNTHNASVDRIDSNVGYTAGNLQLVCYAVNIMKTNMTDEEFRGWCADVTNTAKGLPA